MRAQKIARWQRDHVFNQDRQRTGERRTLLIIVVTAAMTVVKIAAGLTHGSMALLAEHPKFTGKPLCPSRYAQQ